MLLDPGGAYEFNGRRETYPDIRLVYWAGGNPFHHHQDLNRLQRAWQKPETIVVHESWWNPTARHADIVLPATTPLERNDIGGSSRDPFIFAMHRAIDPVHEARNDFDIFRALARAPRLRGQTFTEGRDEMGWCQWVYDSLRAQAQRQGVDLPGFQQFWAEGFVELPPPERDFVLFEDFRRDPEKHPLNTPSRTIEIASDTIARFGYDDCPPHPAWFAPAEWLGGRGRRALADPPRDPPAGGAPAQPDGPAARSRAARKIAGREPIRHQSGRRGAARHPRRRRGARVQRPRRLPCRARCSTTA